MNKYNVFSNSVQKNSYENSIKDVFDICENKYSKEEIKNILLSEADDIKPFAIINIESIDSKEEFDLFISHLINHDGRIRECVSCVLSNLKIKEEFFDESAFDIIVKSILDINPNVTRNVIDFITNNEFLKQKLTQTIINKTKETLFELSKFKKNHYGENSEKSKKNHAKNRYTFNLYWLLEMISVLDIENNAEIESILTETSSFIDYTIREKSAKILSRMKNPPPKLLHKLKTDVNIYVKNQLL